PATRTSALATNLQLVQTLTDADGDHTSTSVNLGSSTFTIQDSRPPQNTLFPNTTPFRSDESVNGTDQPTVGATPPPGVHTLTHDYSVKFGALTLAIFGTVGPEGGTVASGTTYKFTLSGSGIGSGLYALDPSDVLPATGPG